jgi:Na+/H+ antiporter NhaD/arsenite permease-like protein
MTIASRSVYFLAGASALYMVLAPFLSDMPNSRPAWVTAALGCGAVLLLASCPVTRKTGSRLAAAGSGIIVALYAVFLIVPILIRYGYYHHEVRLVATHEAPRWRYTFDKPMLILLLASGLISFCVALPSLLPANDGARELNRT